jgi:hypothetical protein
VYRLGRVKRLQAEIEPEGRMAKLIIEVDDPLCQKAENKQLSPLMLGTYVRVDLEGNTIDDAIKLPETTLHDNQQLWLLTDKQTLEVRAVKPLWTELGFVYLSKNQLPDNPRIISSELSTPVPGMSVRTREQIALELP